MMRLFALCLCLGALGALPQEPRTRPSRERVDRADLLMELVARVQWPLPAEKDLLLLARPEDVDPRGRSLRLGPWLWNRRWKFALPMRLPRRMESPFRGARLDADGRGQIRLGPDRLPFGFRLVRSQDSKRLWPSQTQPGPCLILHLDSLAKLLPDAVARRRFVRDLLLPAFRTTSATSAPDPRPVRPRFHSRELRGLPLLGFLHEDPQGHLTPSALQASGFRSVKHKSEWRIYRRLLQDLLSGIRWPLPDPPEGRSARRIRPDDSYNRDGLEDHAALDLGSLSDKDGRPRVWPAGTPVASPLAQARAYKISRSDGRAWIHETRRGRYRLRLLVALYHVDRVGNHLALARPAQGGFERSDPWAVFRGWPKGPHCHLEIVGIAPGNPEREAFFVRHALQPTLLAADPGIAQAGRTRALPTPHPDALGRSLTDLASSLPTMPGLRTCTVEGGPRKLSATYRLELPRSFEPGSGWRREGQKTIWRLRPEGQGLGHITLQGRSGRVQAEIRFDLPLGAAWLRGLGAPVRRGLLTDLVPTLLLRQAGQPVK